MLSWTASDPRRFSISLRSRLARLSEFNQKAYELFAQPLVQAMSNEVTAEIGRRLRQTNQLVTQRVTRNINVEMDEKMTIGQRVADKVASFGGSWTFIFIYTGFLLAWIAVNTFVLSRMGEAASGGRQFDPYPYILLNLMLSMTAALQAPIIMMSQNRSGEKDRLAAENDFRVNLKSELMLEELTRRMDRLQNDQVEEILLLTRALKEHAPEPAAAADNGTPPTGAT